MFAGDVRSWRERVRVPFDARKIAVRCGLSYSMYSCMLYTRERERALISAARLSVLSLYPPHACTRTLYKAFKSWVLIYAQPYITLLLYNIYGHECGIRCTYILCNRITILYIPRFAIVAEAIYSYISGVANLKLSSQVHTSKVSIIRMTTVHKLLKSFIF